ncbi:conserved hypothetical protein [Neospora caninum Liverpool]|uniref:Transmembrane protein n=1 Tax=Neospora caninum (strain Liverpool) TaxID=572307 RepID=F0VRP0_NEOCL|nr:conserved hypothetical protein [Neospora caninum Liverpool]CBZ56388.1 conserved hypothetical protein [Neospora caninum Liverpool]|eukprot:XP_003886413.1 conserved hypothetical protein [Neospora caninum Liverpool]
MSDREGRPTAAASPVDVHTGLASFFASSRLFGTCLTGLLRLLPCSLLVTFFFFLSLFCFFSLSSPPQPPSSSSSRSLFDFPLRSPSSLPSLLSRLPFLLLPRLLTPLLRTFSPSIARLLARLRLCHRDTPTLSVSSASSPPSSSPFLSSQLTLSRFFLVGPPASPALRVFEADSFPQMQPRRLYSSRTVQVGPPETYTGFSVDALWSAFLSGPQEYFLCLWFLSSMAMFGCFCSWICQQRTFQRAVLVSP